MGVSAFSFNRERKCSVSEQQARYQTHRHNRVFQICSMFFAVHQQHATFLIIRLQHDAGRRTQPAMSDSLVSSFIAASHWRDLSKCLRCGLLPKSFFSINYHDEPVTAAGRWRDGSERER